MNSKILDWFGFGRPMATSGDGHSHSHGTTDATITTTARGLWAVKWSLGILAVTAALQLIVVAMTGSVALLADAIHNVGDATTAIPLWVAFLFARRKPTAKFTYGYGRVEDIAGVMIVLIILFSAIVAGYEAIDRLLHPQPVSSLIWVGMAGLVGFIGNEAVAVFRIRVGREINSAALIADGYHARTDGLTSLAVVVGAVGVWAGFPLADPIIGLLITLTIFVIVWQSAVAVLTRMLDGVEPGTLEDIHHAAADVPGIVRVTDAKARWLGHRLHADVTIEVDDALPLAAANRIAGTLQQELFAHLPALAVANVRFNLAESPAVAVPAHGHAHAPAPFHVHSELAEGLLELVDMADGKRLRLTISRAASGLEAVVTIDRGPGLEETLALLPAKGKRGVSLSTFVPSEPHTFDARLHLKAGALEVTLPFRMAEPDHHG